MSNTFKIIPWLCLLLSLFTEGTVSCFVLNFTFSTKDVCFFGGNGGFYPHFLYSPTLIVVGEDLSLSLVLECLSCSRYKNKLIFLPHPPGQEGRSVASERRVCCWNSPSLSLSLFQTIHCRRFTMDASYSAETFFLFQIHSQIQHHYTQDYLAYFQYYSSLPCHPLGGDFLYRASLVLFTEKSGPFWAIHRFLCKNHSFHE